MSRIERKVLGYLKHEDIIHLFQIQTDDVFILQLPNFFSILLIADTYLFVLKNRNCP